MGFISRRLINMLLAILPALFIVLALLTFILVSIGKDPVIVAQQFMDGALGSDQRRADVIMLSLPLLLCASGLLLTFTAGLWNIGVEGQVTMGAIFGTGIALLAVPESNPLIMIPLELLAAALGGALWAALAAVLKTRGNVNEIFGGVALNFIANNFLLFLISGPWEAGTSPQTRTFDAPALLPRLIPALKLSLPAIIITILGYLLVVYLLNGTHWGLQLRAMGRNQRSAFLLGVRTERNVILSMMLCGALAGLAGALLVISPVSRGQLIPNIASGRGFLGVLIVLLVNVQPLVVPLIALFFGLVPVGTLNLQISQAIDPSLGSVFQSALVLAVLLINGLRKRIQRSRKAA